MRTEFHHGCGYYIAWFFKCYNPTDSGWIMANTPDDTPLAEMDSFFLRSMEVVQLTMNTIRKENMDRQK